MHRVLVPTALVAAFAGAATPAAGHEEYGRREGMDCRACHVGSEGGPLTPVGREYLWGGGARLLPGGEEAGAGAAPGRFGDWSGEAIFWGRAGRQRVLGERESVNTATGLLRLAADRFLGSERWTFQAETLARHVDGPSDAFPDSAVDLVDLEARWNDEEGDTALRLGRHWVTLGVGVHRLDGASLHQDLGRLEVDAYAGLPAENALGGAGGDLLTGGRVGLRGGQFQAGVSGFYLKDQADPADAKAGLDLAWTPGRKFSASGLLAYDWIADEIYDSRLYLTWRPDLFWTWSAGWSRTVPGLFLPKNSIFSVFSLDEYQEASLALTRRLTERLSLRLFDQHTFYADDSRLVRLGAGLDGRYGPGGEDRAGAEVGYQDEQRHPNGATRVDGDAAFLRAYHLLYWTRCVYTSEDVLLNVYAGDPYGRDTRVARLLLGYDPRGSWEVQVGAEHYRTPEFASRLDLVARLTVRF